MVPSPPDSGSLEQKILARIRAAVRSLANVKAEIAKEGIKGDTEDSLKGLLVGIIDKIETEGEQLLDEIAEIADKNAKADRAETIHTNLELFLFQVQSIRTGSTQVPTQLIFLTKATLRRLGYEDVRVVLTADSSLETWNLSEALKHLFRSFHAVLSFIESSSPFYWVIRVPPSFIRTPLNWPLITHEIGHILERQKWGTVAKHYAYPAYASLSPLAIKSHYSREFQADFVAVSFFGPIFARRLLESYYTRETLIAKTHPSWKQRFEALADHLEERFPAEADLLRESSAAEESSLISRASIEHLTEIVSETSSAINAAKATYVQDLAREESAKRRLRRFAAYTEDMRVLLNVADSVRDELLQSVEIPSERSNVERQFDYLLMDSVRLNYVRELIGPSGLAST